MSMTHLFYNPPARDTQKCLEQVKAAYGIEHPEKINGFTGAFILTLPEVYLSDELYNKLKECPSLETELNRILNAIHKEEYGDISDEDRDYNGEQRWLAGTYDGVTALFHTEFGIIRFECEDNKALLTLTK